MHYCVRCLMPSTKPHIVFDDKGVCGACRVHDEISAFQQTVDWQQRSDAFEEHVARARDRKAPLYDVLVPVSGGKDSISQVARLLGRGLRILAVNVDYGIKTEIGLRNLSIIQKMGANLIVYQPEPELHWRLIKLGLVEHGDPDLMSHTMLHGFPLHVAKQFEIPLVLLGENSAFEYSGDEIIGESPVMTRKWFDNYAANSGKDATYVSDTYDIPPERLATYDFPDDLDEHGVTATFMSYYFPWDSEDHFATARKFGFEALQHPMEGTFRTYAGIDEKINRIHQYLKVLKFGYGRATDHACEDIRQGRLTRDEARELVRQHDLLPLSDYFTQEFIQLAGMTQTEFDQTLERWRNQDIWKQNSDGDWFIPGHLMDEHEDARVEV